MLKLYFTNFKPLFRMFLVFSHNWILVKKTYTNMELNFSGVAIGVATFLVIGLFHPLVIKAEYYIGVRSWWLFLLLGIVTGVASLLVHNLILSILLGDRKSTRLNSSHCL